MPAARQGRAPTRPRPAAGLVPPGLVAAAQGGLGRRPYTMPPLYFYDDLGSALFDAICRLPWYGLTRAELALLDRHAGEIGRLVERADLVVELGPGSGEKIGRIVRAAARPRQRLHLVDVSDAALALARAHLEGIAEVEVTTDAATFDEGLARVARGTDERLLFLFLGSNIGNFAPFEARALLRRMRAAARPGDYLLLGADLVKPVATLLRAYDDPLGVTAAFNRNLLVRLNRELDAEFELDAFEHRARWDERSSRVEMHLVSRRAQRVRVPGADMVVDFRRGDTIWTESSHKFTPERIAAILGTAGWTTHRQWVEAENPFALTLATAA